MYVKAEQFDKAAAILIHTKNFTAVTPLLDKITLPKLHAQYAKVSCDTVVVAMLVSCVGVFTGVRQTRFAIVARMWDPFLVNAPSCLAMPFYLCHHRLIPSATPPMLGSLFPFL